MPTPITPTADMPLAPWREVSDYRSRLLELLRRAPDEVSRAIIEGALAALQQYYLALRASTPGGFEARKEATL